VEEYAKGFEEMRYVLLMLNTSLGDMFFVSQFMKGLKPELKGSVMSQVLALVDKAILLAKIQEKLQEKGKFKATKPAMGKSSNFNARPDYKSNQSTSGLWKERQIRDLRKANEQCMYCGKPNDPTHPEKCKVRVRTQLNALVCNDLDQPLSEDVLNQLEEEDALTEEFVQLSLHAVDGVDKEGCIKLRSLVQNKVMLTFVDSSNSTSFVNATFLNKMGILPKSCAPIQVKLRMAMVRFRVGYPRVSGLVGLGLGMISHPWF
jgi:hypothetical protein